MLNTFIKPRESSRNTRPMIAMWGGGRLRVSHDILELCTERQTWRLIVKWRTESEALSYFTVTILVL